MKFALPLAAALIAAPLSFASATNPDEEGTKPAAEAAEASKEKGDAASGEVEAKEEKRICRRIRADASSRRKTKLCLTSDEWRQYNNIK